MPAGALTVVNTAAVWTDLVKLSPMVWLEGARVALEMVRPVLDLYDTDQMDQFNRDYGAIASSGFGKHLTEGQDYRVRTNNQEDTLSLTVVKRGDAFTITEDLIDGNKYREIRIGMEDLGGSLFRTRARDSTHVGFSFGFSSSFTDAEGYTVTNAIAKGSEPIFDDTHTMAESSTADNELADTALGESSLRSLQDLTTSFVDENGLRIPWGRMGTRYLVHTDDVPNEHQARKLTEQDWNLASSSRDENMFKGAYQRVPLFYLNTTATGAIDSTKDKYYFILDSEYMKRKAVLGLHTAPTPRGPFEDNWNGGMLWRSKTRYDIGFQAYYVGAGSPATT